MSGHRSYFLRRSLRFHWRTNMAVVLGVAVGTTTLTGALLVGDSVRGSLRQTALDRLAGVDFALTSGRFFREALSSDLSAVKGFADRFDQAIPIIAVRGSITHASTHTRASQVSVLGVDDRFWNLAPTFTRRTSQAIALEALADRALAAEIGVSAGEEVLLRIEKVGATATETLVGRRDDSTVARRVKVSEVVDDVAFGSFQLSIGQISDRAIFIGLNALQKALGQEGRVNTLLVKGVGRPESNIRELSRFLEASTDITDLGLRVRIDDVHGYVAAESEGFLLEPAVEEAAMAAARAIGAPTTSILTYLANEIAVRPAGENARFGRAIPYSTVAALDEIVEGMAPLRLSTSQRGASSDERFDSPTAEALSYPSIIAPPPRKEVGHPALKPGEILLNEWAAREAAAGVGDTIELSFYVPDAFGMLETRRASFTLVGVVRLEGGANDRGFTPEYPGVTDVDRLSDWDPPFPVDLAKITDADEAYWDRYRTTPKAFIRLADGQRLWATNASRFGRVTSIRIPALAAMDLHRTADLFAAELRDELDVSRMGLRFEPVAEQALAASTGSTDFSMLFVGFSLFLIASAAMLTALLFRLGVERRSAEVGLLLCVGFSPAATTVALLREGAVVAATGGAIGLVGAIGYAWLMLAGLRSWWSEAAPESILHVYVGPGSLIVGYAAGFALAALAIGWSIRGLTRLSARSLLAGGRVDSYVGKVRERIFVPATPVVPTIVLAAAKRAVRIEYVGLLCAIVLLLCSAFGFEFLSDSELFFVSGAALLAAVLAACRRVLSLRPARLIHQAGPAAMARLGLRNAPRHARRSMLTIGLIASATFVITAVGAFRVEVHEAQHDMASGAGGFSLMAEAALPLSFDVNTAAGRDALNVNAPSGLLDDVVFVPFRLRHGDDSSCRNLYRPNEPRILGAGEGMIRRGGFRFASVLRKAPDEEDHRSPTSNGGGPPDEKRFDSPTAEAMGRPSDGDSTPPPLKRWATHDAEERQGNPWLLLQKNFPDGAIPVIGDESSVTWQWHLGLGKDLTITDDRGRRRVLRFIALLKDSILQNELVVSEANFTELFPLRGGYAFHLIDAPAHKAAEVLRLLEAELEPFGFDATSTAVRLAEYTAVRNTYLSTFQTLGGLGLILGTLGLAAVMMRNVRERRGEIALLKALGFSSAALGGMVMAENAVLVVGGLLAGIVPALLAVAPHLAGGTAMPWRSLGLTFASVFIVGMVSGAAAVRSAIRAPLLPTLRAE